MSIDFTTEEIDELLTKDSLDDDRYHDFMMPELDIQIICKALQGKDPVDDVEQQQREIILNGLLYMLNEYEESKQ